MPSLFWLALLLGFLTGVSAAVLLLPARLIEPLYGPLALTTVVVTAAFGALRRLRCEGRLEVAQQHAVQRGLEEGDAIVGRDQGIHQRAEGGGRRRREGGHPGGRAHAQPSAATGPKPPPTSPTAPPSPRVNRLELTTS